MRAADILEVGLDNCSCKIFGESLVLGSAHMNCPIHL